MVSNQNNQLISVIDNKIDVITKLNSNSESQLSLLFIDRFVFCSQNFDENFVETDWGKIPESWKTVTLGDIISISSGDRPKIKVDNPSTDFNIPIYGASKIMGYTNEKTYDEPILIIGRVGTHGIVQRVYDICFPSDNTFVIRSKYFAYVYQILNRIDYDSLNVGSTQPLLTQKSLKNFKVPLQSENELLEFESISKAYFKQIEINKNGIKFLEKLRDTLLPKLMNGDIDVSGIKING